MCHPCKQNEIHVDLDNSRYYDYILMLRGFSGCITAKNSNKVVRFFSHMTRSVMVIAVVRELCSPAQLWPYSIAYSAGNSGYIAGEFPWLCNVGKSVSFSEY